MKRILILTFLIIAAIELAGQQKVNTGNERNNTQDTKITPGASGVRRSIGYTFSTIIDDSDPGRSLFRYNNKDVSKVTWLYVDNIDIAGEDQTKWYSTWDDTTGASGRGSINIVESEGKNINMFNITGVFVKGNGYWKIPVEYISGKIPAGNTVYYYVFNRIAHKKPQPGQVPQPAPEQQPVITPQPQPMPAPVPQPEPEQQPVITQQPQPTPAPIPQPEPEQQPVITQQPQPMPAPVPQPEPEQEPVITKQPQPKPAPVPQPVPEQEPVIAQQPQPAAAPAPETQPQARQTVPARETTQYSDRRQPAQPAQTTTPSKPEPAAEPPKTTRPAQTTQTRTEAQNSVPAQPAPSQPGQQKPSVPASQPFDPAPYNAAAQVNRPPDISNPYENLDLTERNRRKCYRGIIELGYALGTGEYGISNFRFNFINGIMIGKVSSIGLGLGYRRYFEGLENYTDRKLYSPVDQIPVFLDLRTSFTRKKVTPYLALGLGGSSSFIKVNPDSTTTRQEGLYFSPSGGIWFNISDRFAVFAGVAYELQRLEYVLIADDSHFRRNSSSVSLNIGIAF